MSRGQVLAWSLLALLAGLGLIAYLFINVPPTLPGGEFNTPALILLLIGLFLATTGISSTVALALHKRWPTLAGVRGPRRQQPIPGVALRQGLFFGTAMIVISLLALWQVLDLVFVLVTLVLLGLLEVYLQSRQ